MPGYPGPALSSVRLRPWLRGPLIATAGALLFGAWCMFVYRQTLLWVPNSDNATLVLSGASLAHGDLLLHGWRLGSDSFWLNEVLLNAAGVRVAGISPAVEVGVAYAIWILLAAVGIGVASWSRGGVAAALAAAATFCLMGLPGAGLLEQGIHIGTTLFGIAYIGGTLLWAAGRGWAWGAVAAVLLAADIASDPLSIAFAAAPAVLAAAVSAMYSRRLQPWFGVVAVAVVATAGGLLAPQLAKLSGGFDTTSISGHIAHYPHAPRTSGLALLMLLGAGAPATPDAATWTRLATRGAIAALALLGATRIPVLLWRGDPELPSTERSALELWLLVLLLSGAVLTTALFAFYAYDPGAAGRRLMPAFACLAIAAGRLVGLVSWRRGMVRLPVLAGAMALALATLYLIGSADIAPVPTNRPAVASRFLVTHGLREGLGSYWAANILTVDSGGRAMVRPVFLNGARFSPWINNVNLDWYGPGEAPDFMVWDEQSPTFGVDAGSAQRIYGSARMRYEVAGFTILVWDRPLPNSPT